MTEVSGVVDGQLGRDMTFIREELCRIIASASRFQTVKEAHAALLCVSRFEREFRHDFPKDNDGAAEGGGI